MLWIKYQVVQSTVGEEDVLVNKKIGYSEANIAIAEAEAYNGKYEVVEDGKSYNDEPLAIEFGGTGAKTAAEALQKIGAAPAGYVAYTGWFNSDDMLTTKLTEAYAGIADNKIGFAELESTSNTITLTQGKWFFTMYRSSAEYGVVTAIRYDSANVVAIMQRSLIGGTWGAWKNGSPSAFAPAGYGLGTSAKELTSADNLDNIWQNGNYFWNGSVPTNAPVFDSSTQGAYGYMRVDCKDNGTYTQMIRSAHVPNIGITVIRTRIGDAIIEEWDNPPMIPGEEYRTTERIDGKAVYKKKSGGFIYYRLEGDEVAVTPTVWMDGIFNRINGVNMRSLYFGENTTTRIQLYGRGAYLVGVTFNSGSGALYIIYAYSSNQPLNRVQKIDGGGGLELGFVLDTSNGELEITCPQQWCYGFIIGSGSSIGWV